MADTKKNILIIEDDDDIRSTLRSLLEGAGYSITEAGDGNEGERRIAADNPDLVILDLKLPGRTGQDILKSMEVDTQTKDIPTVVLTGTGSVSKQLSCLRTGAVGYLSKPFRVVELLKTVKKFI